MKRDFKGMLIITIGFLISLIFYSQGFTSWYIYWLIGVYTGELAVVVRNKKYEI